MTPRRNLKHQIIEEDTHSTKFLRVGKNRITFMRQAHLSFSNLSHWFGSTHQTNTALKNIVLKNFTLRILSWRILP